MLRAVTMLPTKNTPSPAALMASRMSCSRRNGATASSTDCSSRAAASVPGERPSITTRVAYHSPSRFTVASAAAGPAASWRNWADRRSACSAASRLASVGCTCQAPSAKRTASTARSPAICSTSRSSAAPSGKPIDTWPMGCGARTATVTIWKGRPSNTATVLASAVAAPWRGSMASACSAASGWPVLVATSWPRRSA